MSIIFFLVKFLHKNTGNSTPMEFRSSQFSNAKHSRDPYSMSYFVLLLFFIVSPSFSLFVNSENYHYYFRLCRRATIYHGFLKLKFLLLFRFPFVGSSNSYIKCYKFGANALIKFFSFIALPVSRLQLVQLPHHFETKHQSNLPFISSNSDR